MIKILLHKELFSSEKKEILSSKSFDVYAFKYSTGIEAIEIKNAKGRIVVLPFMGQMIWEAEFLGVNMCMENMFSEPRKATNIIETYGCFAFHSGLLRNGCPGDTDDHPLHGEFACADINESWIEMNESEVKLVSSFEYVMGFGHHYHALPSVSLKSKESALTINMQVKNLGGSPMPLQYMCHINSRYIKNAEFTQNVPDSIINLRKTIPAHVKPNKQWLRFNKILGESKPISKLDQEEMYNPEIVYFMDELSQVTDKAIFEMASPEGFNLFTEFSTKDFNYATRWILKNEDQSVAAYALPVTCRPEGFNAAKENNTVIYLKKNESRRFSTKTGIRIGV
ncbi:aldose 1-epimerase family protein [Photobacterium leiognathi]|uniref:aldose 1-epimerase family protein n=1 Tax=Photobacterium leiognathi TaxID=553611 RepID=UPI001EE10C2A|nr:aldose 1-epimerase family protein [Photobacterium leiognathi]MCG3884837.1 aldose 1-epimerase family protein [Photobacterium leiognathi]